MRRSNTTNPKICVVGEHNASALTYVKVAARKVAGHVSVGNLVIVMAISAVGTTTERVAQSSLEERGDIEGGPIQVALYRERVLPDRILDELISNDRIVGSIDAASTDVGLTSRDDIDEIRPGPALEIDQAVPESRGADLVVGLIEHRNLEKIRAVHVEQLVVDPRQDVGVLVRALAPEARSPDDPRRSETQLDGSTVDGYAESFHVQV